MTDDEPTDRDPVDGQPFRRRQRYRGTHPRHYEEKYKELSPTLDPEMVAKLIDSGKTPLLVSSQTPFTKEESGAYLFIHHRASVTRSAL